MKAFASLSNRIFFATALLAVLSIAAAIYIVNVAVTNQAEAELRNGLTEASSLVDEYRALRFDHFVNEARLVADLPRLKAAVDTNDPETVKPVATGYQEQLKADFFVITRAGRLLARFGGEGLSDEELMRAPGMQSSSARETIAFWPASNGVLQVVSVPIFIEYRPTPAAVEPETTPKAAPQTVSDLTGTLIVGVSLDTTAAAHIKTLTNSDIVFAARGAVQAATLPKSLWPALQPLLSTKGTTAQVKLGQNEYIALAKPLALEGTPAPEGDPTVIILQSRTERLAFLKTLHTELAATAVFAVLAATLLSYAIARTVTRPLGTITATMRDMATTGDLTRRIPVRADPGWQDEDAHLLAKTFNTMTESIQRFQREAAQRERLSSLGRLSTVVAHEIRNPLMIIKTALRTLRREEVKPEQLQNAVRDIDEEISRLNRIVNEVLDFARPIKFDLSPADLNALASDAVRATGAGGGKPEVGLQLDPSLPAVTTDAERLRQVLLNVLSNAVQAVEARPAPPSAPDPEVPIRMQVQRVDGNRVAIVVRDRGTGIAPENLAKVFDPYFTTRRTGTGIGLAISRNIVEGLGGRISVSSQPERGTEVRIELPLHSTAA